MPTTTTTPPAQVAPVNVSHNDQINLDFSEMAGTFHQISPILDHLFLCGYAALQPDRIQHQGVTHIINCSMDIPCPAIGKIAYIRVPVHDMPKSNLSPYFDKCADYIQNVKSKGGKVLVHCMAGVSRSASICIVYLMKYYKMTLAQAYTYVRTKRPVIRPNHGFFQQMIMYENKLFGKNTVKMVNSPIGLIPDLYQKDISGMVWLTDMKGNVNNSVPMVPKSSLNTMSPSTIPRQTINMSTAQSTIPRQTISLTPSASGSQPSSSAYHIQSSTYKKNPGSGVTSVNTHPSSSMVPVQKKTYKTVLPPVSTQAFTNAVFTAHKPNTHVNNNPAYSNHIATTSKTTTTPVIKPLSSSADSFKRSPGYRYVPNGSSMYRSAPNFGSQGVTPSITPQPLTTYQLSYGTTAKLY